MAAAQPPCHALSLEDAQACILARLAPVATLERVAIRAALDRVPGMDVAAHDGTTVLVAGRRIGPADLGVLAGAGVAEVMVRRRVRVAIFALDSRQHRPGARPDPDAMAEGNRHALYGMLAQAGAAVLDLGAIRHEPQALRETFSRVASTVDVVVAISGITVRSPAWVRGMLAESGDIDFLDVRVKPCRPIPFGRLHGGAVFFGFSSHPLPLAVMFHQLVRPALARLAGLAARAPLTFTARARAAFHGVPGWRNFRRGRLEWDAAGEPTVDLAAPADPGVLRTLRDANCFIVLPEDCVPVQPGDRVRVEPFADPFGCGVACGPDVVALQP